MEKIRIMTDSACDISPEQEKEHDIKIMCFPITLGDKGFMERIDLTNEQFYEMIEASEELPKTAQVTVPRFEEAYKEVMDEGYTDLIYVSIASKGSNTNASAHMARDNFYEEYPEAIPHSHCRFKKLHGRLRLPRHTVCYKSNKGCVRCGYSGIFRRLVLLR